MSSIEERAKELYPTLETDKIGNNPYISYNVEQLAKQEGFVKGYHQAEKDLEMTWEDVRKIVLLYERLVDDENIQTLPIKDAYTELLKRFKDFKERKKK